MDSSIVVTQFTSAAVFVWGMQRLKDAAWFPLLKNEGQVWIKRGTSIAAAIGTHTGISHVWSPGPISAPGSHILAITFPPLAVILVTLWHWLGQYAIQETIYQGVSNKSPAAPSSSGGLQVEPTPGPKLDAAPAKG